MTARALAGESRRGTTASFTALDSGGHERSSAKLILIRTGRAPLPRLMVKDGNGNTIRAVKRSPDRMEYRVPASGGVTVLWR